MKFKTTDVAGTIEILASDIFQAIPMKIAGTDVVKAGMPIKADGTAIAAGTGAVGILLYDVDPAANPNGAVVVSGIVDWTKCMSHSGATATAAAIKEIIPTIEFRTNIGVQS